MRKVFLVFMLFAAFISARAVNVTFQVDMSQMVVSPLGVFLAGDFQGWNPSTTPMTDLGGGIYSITIDLPAGTYQYKFINGNAWGTDETVPVSCGVDDGMGIYNRAVTISADVILPSICFGQCAPCQPASYVMNGNASSMGGDCYQVTPPLAWQNGAFWSNTQLDLTKDFSLQFNMKLGSNDASGADGVVFVLQRLGSNVIGASGGGMGYSSFGTSLGVEFDTFQNPEYNDPAEDHIAIEINGDVNHYAPNNIGWPVQMSATNPNTEDGSDHVASIQWNATTHIISVYFDCVFRLQAQYDLINDVFGGQNLAFWGFTGATGAQFNQQTICAVPNALETSEVTICPGSSVMLNAGASSDDIYMWSPVSYLDDPSLRNPTATPPSTMLYEVTYHDLCNALVTKQITVNVESSGPGCFILPVRLVNFEISSQGSKNYYNWTTVAETQNAFFILEESLDAKHFAELSRIGSQQNSNDILNYHSESERRFKDCYYRLKQMDYSGRMEIVSDVIFVNGLENGKFQLSTNTAQNTCTIRGTFPNSKLRLELHGVTGNLIATSTWMDAGIDQITMSIPENLNFGIFVLRDENGLVIYSNKRAF